MRNGTAGLVAGIGLTLAACGSSHSSSRDAAAYDAAAHDGLVSADAPRDVRNERDASRESDGPRESAPVDAGSDAGKTCSDGSPVAYARTSCPGVPPSVPGALAAALGSASRGAVVGLDGLDEATSPCAPVVVCIPSGAPTLLFSDEPESPSSDGVLYADIVGPGPYRAYVYHTNAGSGLRKFPVVLLNQGASDVHVTLGRRGVAGPSSDYVAVGKQAVQAWLASTGSAALVVPPGKRVLLDASLDAVHASNGELAHGILDFTLDGPVKASVVSIAASEDATVVTASLSLLPNTGMHLRGSFPGAALEIESTVALDASGVRHLDFGGGVTDMTLTGHDYVDGTSVKLEGNYGVPYSIHLDLGAKSALLVAPQGGQWGGVAELPAGLDALAGTTMLPASSDSLGSQTKAIFAGRYAAGTAAMLLMTAGGSNLPIDLASVPVP